MKISVTDYVNQACSVVLKLEAGEEFVVKDLFIGYEWNRIPKADRLRIGMAFYEKVKSTPSLNIGEPEKTTSNQQKYKKVR